MSDKTAKGGQTPIPNALLGVVRPETTLPSGTGRETAGPTPIPKVPTNVAPSTPPPAKKK